MVLPLLWKQNKTKKQCPSDCSASMMALIWCKWVTTQSTIARWAQNTPRVVYEMVEPQATVSGHFLLDFLSYYTEETQGLRQYFVLNKCQGLKIIWYLFHCLLTVPWLLESESEVAQSCPILCDPMDCSLPGSSLHGILQARILEWVAISFSRGSSQLRYQTQVSCIAGRRFNLWATGEALGSP